ncbi:MAG: DUF4870 domain-containing protein [Methanoregula sp.]|jgi:uncharacterized membrane protein
MDKATFGLDENVASAACYVLGWLTGIIFLLMEKDNKTVRFHAMQSILTFLPLTIISVVIGMIQFIGIISLLIWLVMVILWLVLIIKTFQGEKFMVPVVGEMAEKQIN